MQGMHTTRDRLCPSRDQVADRRMIGKLLPGTVFPTLSLCTYMVQGLRLMIQIISKRSFARQTLQAQLSSCDTAVSLLISAQQKKHISKGQK